MGPDLLTALLTSFNIKIDLFTKDVQWRISAENVWKVIFAPDITEYAFVEFPFQIQNLWEESIKINHATWFNNDWYLGHYLTPKKACLIAGGNLRCSL